MAKKDEITKQALKLLRDEGYYFIEDLVAHLPISKKTFYNYKLHELQELKDLLDNNKIKTKTKLRKNWENSTNATLNIALYKLLATDTERKILSDSEIIVNFKDLPTNIDELSDEEIEKLYEEQTSRSQAEDS